ncbi:hypothetical protein GGR54DRAFT_343203 [Hypoxylon sp. NC1633]|nr:hypothetical protein GGR54DRAFT_343203 [Hypoxylon sp. NC1633]
MSLKASRGGFRVSSCAYSVDSSADWTLGSHPRCSERWQFGRHKPKPKPSTLQTKNVGILTLPPGQKTPCYYFYRNFCNRGDNCRYSHDPKDQALFEQTCPHYLKGRCTMGSKCKMKHNLLSKKTESTTSYSSPKPSVSARTPGLAGVQGRNPVKKGYKTDAVLCGPNMASQKKAAVWGQAQPLTPPNGASLARDKDTGNKEEQKAEKTNNGHLLSKTSWADEIDALLSPSRKGFTHSTGRSGNGTPEKDQNDGTRRTEEKAEKHTGGSGGSSTPTKCMTPSSSPGAIEAPRINDKNAPGRPLAPRTSPTRKASPLAPSGTPGASRSPSQAKEETSKAEQVKPQETLFRKPGLSYSKVARDSPVTSGPAPTLAPAASAPNSAPASTPAAVATLAKGHSGNGSGGDTGGSGGGPVKWKKLVFAQHAKKPGGDGGKN